MIKNPSKLPLNHNSRDILKILNEGIIASSPSQHLKRYISKNKIQFIIGYNYILPKALEPDLIFAEDVVHEYSYNNSSLDSTQRLLKYRFKHSFKFDLEYKRKDDFAIGVSAKFFSRIENLDRSIEEFESATLNTGCTLQPV